MAPTSPLFLLIDDNQDRRALLLRTIRRKFPDAVVRECAQADSAVACLRDERPDAVVLHRAGDADGSALLDLIRKTNHSVPVVYLAVGEQARQAVESAGARFLSYEGWLNIGTVLEALLRAAL